MIGKKFTKLTVIEFVGKNKHGKLIWKCKCDCGKIIETLGVYLRNGDTNSCGCYGKEQRFKSLFKHGLSRKNNTEYEIWKGMKARCYNKNHKGYSKYGGRGIKVCIRWERSFLAFLKDMGKRPSPQHSLDRYPNMNGDYEMVNCRWATPDQQSRNKRSNRFFTKNGQTMVMEDWAKYFRVDQSTLHEHLKTKDFDSIFSFYSKKNQLLEDNPTMAEEIKTKLTTPNE